jgi:hypothetical protein
MDYRASHYTLKLGSVMVPKLHLGAQVSKFYIDGSADHKKPIWAMSLEKNVKQATCCRCAHGFGYDSHITGHVTDLSWIQDQSHELVTK